MRNAESCNYFLAITGKISSSLAFSSSPLRFFAMMIPFVSSNAFDGMERMP